MIESPQGLMLLAAVGFILFGSKKLPDMAKSLGQGIVEFKKALNQETDDPNKAAQPTPQASETAPASTAPAEAAPKTGQG